MAITDSTPTGAVSPDSLGDRVAIVDVTSRLCLLVDARDWDALVDLFTDPVAVDYTSLNGGDPQTMDPRDLVAAWRAALEPLDATQHLIGGHVVSLDGDDATCAASVQGTHVLANRTGGSAWTVGGRYDFRLRRGEDGWRIAAITLTVQCATGNRDIMQTRPGSR